MRRFNLGYFFIEGCKSIFTHGLMSFAAVCMIVCCLLIMGSFSLVAVNLDNMLGDLERENEFLAYVDETLSQEEAKALQPVLEAIPNVAQVTFVSKEEAMESFKADKDREGNELFESLPASVLEDRFRIHVDDISLLRQTVEQVRQTTGISDIRAEYEIAQGFLVVRNIAGAVAVILVAILLLVSLFIITNTIRLSTFNRREEIAIMKMCGATNSFVRWPFAIEGMLLGLLGAGLAFFLQWGIYTLISNAISTSDTIHLITVIPFDQMSVRVFWIFAGTGFVIGTGGSVLAIRKFLQV